MTKITKGPSGVIVGRYAFAKIAAIECIKPPAVTVDKATKARIRKAVKAVLKANASKLSDDDRAAIKAFKTIRKC